MLKPLPCSQLAINNGDQTTLKITDRINRREFSGQLTSNQGMILDTLLGGALLEVDLRLPFLVVGLLNVLALTLTVPFFRMNPPQPSTSLS